MKVQSIQARFTNSYSFRSGEWADVVGIVLVTPDTGGPRLCYHLRYEDGTCDYTPVLAPHDIRVAGDAACAA